MQKYDNIPTAQLPTNRNNHQRSPYCRIVGKQLRKAFKAKSDDKAVNFGFAGQAVTIY